MSEQKTGSELTLPSFEVRKRRSLWKSIVQLYRKKPLGMVSASFAAVLFFIAIFGGAFPIADPYEMNADARFVPPWTTSADGITYPLGTDNLGRDMLSRLILGARVSVLVGVCAVGIAIGLGCTIGIISGYLGGKFDLIVQRWMDAQMSIPSLVLALVIMSLLGTSLVNVIIAIAITRLPGDNRIARGAVFSVKERMFVESARAIGCSVPRIILRHIFPNVLAPIVVVATAGLGGAILVESSLSYLGLGVPAPTPTWGQMIAGAGRQFMTEHPLLLLLPGFALSFTIMVYNLAGDALRDIMDPKLRGA